MDTRFWGPPAWILLHSIAYIYQPNLINEYELFFTNIQNVLPCIYCRDSYTEYIERLPIRPFLKTGRMFEWLYRVHNMVNDKLRQQGLLTTADPSLKEMRSKYKEITESFDTCKTREQSIMGWNFLYCIAFVYPENGSSIAQTSHFSGYMIFFSLLSKLLPDQGGFRDIYNKYISKASFYDALKSRDTLKKWVYDLEKIMDKQQRVKCKPLSRIEEIIEQYRAGCGGKTPDSQPTCRSKSNTKK